MLKVNKAVDNRENIDMGIAKEKESAKNLFDKYMRFVNENKDLIPNFKHIDLTKKQNSFQYVGGQVLNGNLYAIINSSEKMMVYNISKGKMDFIGFFDKTDFKWTGGCIYNNNLYAFPRFENSLLKYCPKTDSFEKIPSDFNYEQEHHYGGVCTKEGIIYQPPRNSDHILKWDIKNRTCKKIQINNGENSRYCGSVIHPNGYAYFIPERDFCVIKMDLRTEKTECIGDVVSGMAFNPVVAPDGNIYGFRSGIGMDGSGIMKIDTVADKVSILHKNFIFGAYGTKNGINGKIYSLPGYTNDVWEFNLLNHELKKCYTLNENESVHYAGGAVNFNGDIYAIPVHANNILKISFGRYERNIPSDIYNAFFRDFY